MLIKIAIFTVIGLSAVALSWLWGPGLWRKFRRDSLESELAAVHDMREKVLKLLRILELPDAYERLLVHGIYFNGRFNASPDARAVRSFIEANGANAVTQDRRYQLSSLMERLQDQEDSVRAALYVIAARDRPANRDLHLIEQRSKIERLEHQLAAEREQLERLEALDRSPDPYGRLPKPPEPRVDKVEAEPEPELAETTSTRKMRA